MKRIINKTTMAVILLLSMVLALLGGIFFAKQTDPANAATPLVTVKIEAKADYDSDEDVTSFTKGTEFVLKITVAPNVPNNLIDSTTLQIGALTDDKTAADPTKCGYLTFSSYTSRATFKKSTNISSSTNYTDNSRLVASGFKDGNILISLARNKGTLTADTEFSYQVSAKVNEDVPDGTDFVFGVILKATSQFTYRKTASDSAKYVFSNNADEFEVQNLSFAVKEPSNVCTLDKLEGGIGDTDLEEIYDSTKNTSFDPENDTLTITVTDLTKPLSLLPTTTDENAKVNIKQTNGTETAKTSNGEIGKIAIPDDGEITVEVVAENGTDKTTYNLLVTVVGGKLEKLDVTTDSTQTGVTKNGLKETFDSTTLAYTVYVPNDQANKVTLKAEVSTGHSELTNVTLSTTGNCSAPVSAVSKSNFDVTEIEDDDTLTIKVKADNGAGTTSEKDYVITFDVVDTDSSMDTITVVGTSSNRTIANSESRATDKKVDYYYMVTGETNASSTVTVAAKSSAAEVALDSATGTSKTLTEGSHTATITAEAGNSTIYSFYLDNYVPLQLKTGVTATYLHLYNTEEGKTFRRAYAQLNWTHGIDDLELDRYVIGQLTEYTSINVFLGNFETSVKSQLKIYNNSNELVYDCGTAKNDYTAADLDDQTKPIATGWKVEYVVNGGVEDTVYLSVLGDFDGDGAVGSGDTGDIGKFIKGEEDKVARFEKAEYALAAYVQNVDGEKPGASDIAEINNVILKDRDITESFYTES